MAASVASSLAALEPFVGALLLVCAALHDIAARTIPDWISASIAAVGLALRTYENTLPQAIAVAALVAIVIGLCWIRGWLGGGDLKLLVALALLLPPSDVLSGIVAVAWCGALLAFPYLVLRHRLPRPSVHRPTSLLARIWRAERFRLHRGGPLPYALAIAIGGILTLFNR